MRVPDARTAPDQAPAGLPAQLRKDQATSLSKRARPLSPQASRSRSTPGQHTLQEILSQAAIWPEAARELARSGIAARLTAEAAPREPWLFVGCGSSYYLAQIAAAVWTKILRAPCRALPASEILFRPEETLGGDRAPQAVLLSRSGETTELLRVAQLLRKRRSPLTLGATCTAASPLESLCSMTLKLTTANEKSTVMTRSFTSLLLAFERLAASLADERALPGALERLPAQVQPWLEPNAAAIRAFGRKHKFSHCVFLGQGWHYWLAQEAALKVTEMSATFAQAFHTLEFRHGPRAIAARNVLVTFLISEAAAAEEIPLVREMQALGARTMVVVNRATPELRRRSDLLVELGLDVTEIARLAVTAIPVQLLGCAIGLRKGLDPDRPRHLTRVVKLEEAAEVPVRKRRP